MSSVPSSILLPLSLSLHFSGFSVILLTITAPGRHGWFEWEARSRWCRQRGRIDDPDRRERLRQGVLKIDLNAVDVVRARTPKGNAIGFAVGCDY